MTGLEKIVKEIEDEAIAKAAKITDEAKAQADSILSEAKKTAEEKCAEIEERSKLEIQSFLSRSESSAKLQKKKLLLDAKQAIISEVLEKARQTLIDLPEKEYFDNIYKLISKYALEQEGIIAFSEKDLKRLPEEFEEKVVEALKDKNGATLCLLQEARNIDGGFVLMYGDIEINCSFEALFLANHENLQDKVCEVLFE